ncbi:Zip-domain-containing protein [Xylariaceae sp. FL0016]|nr:Zip-domain-containing protein [Xylariaceae sp. FL0016]
MPGHTEGCLGSARTAFFAAGIICLCVFDSVTASYISPRVPRASPTLTRAPVIVPRQTESQTTESFTAVSECHMHDASVYCMYGTEEYQVAATVTATSELPATYTDCHSHGDESFCVGPDGSDVEILGFTSEASGEESVADGETESSSSTEGLDCHFHAGVEHCVGAEGEESTASCSRQERDYNIRMRVGLIFAMLATSFIGVAGPIFLKPALSGRLHTVFTVLKQFGTGVIISTAFVHLFTHAELMFTNECLGELEYEATTAAVVMAGIVLAFVVEYTSHRVARHYWDQSSYNDEVVSVGVLEAGIIFHSLLIGITLVVAADSYLITLFIVILFHQMFEGIALGTRIASVGQSLPASDDGKARAPACTDDASASNQQLPVNERMVEERVKSPLSLGKKLGMATAFALVTPIGMAIGTGVVQQFNGNDPSTLIALGTLDALSAGILIWVGVVEMWAGDWMFGGELANAGVAVTLCAGVGLLAGMVLMSFLGKWA